MLSWHLRQAKTDGWTDGQAGEWTHGLLDECMDIRMHVQFHGTTQASLNYNLKSCNPQPEQKSGPSDKGFSMDIIEGALGNVLLWSSLSYTNILTLLVVTHNSIRGRVCPSVRQSVGPWVTRVFFSAKNGRKHIKMRSVMTRR